MKKQPKELTELPDNVFIYGFAFTEDLSGMDMKEIYNQLELRFTPLENVVFSVWDDFASDCTWLVAANRYLDESEVSDVINFIIENALEDAYCLLDINNFFTNGYRSLNSDSDIVPVTIQLN